MVELSRYNVGGDESGAELLPNKLGLQTQYSLDNAEAILYVETYEYFLKKLKPVMLVFNVALLFEIHKLFLGTLYTWAGKIRTVEISKGTTLFCASKFIKTMLEDFEKLLEAHVPTSKDSKKVAAEKLALIHCEFNAIHPFREGNGRTIRLFLDLMVLSCGYDFIDFTKSSTKEYMEACIAGMKTDYSKMERVIFKGLKK